MFGFIALLALMAGAMTICAAIAVVVLVVKLVFNVVLFRIKLAGGLIFGILGVIAAIPSPSSRCPCSPSWFRCWPWSRSWAASSPPSPACAGWASRRWPGSFNRRPARRLTPVASASARARSSGR